DDASTDPSVRQLLEEYARRDARVRVAFREKNGHISAASNTALELATGEFVALLDQDDELTDDALFEIACALSRHPDADVLYSDEDKRAPDGRLVSPRFKPGWSPELLLSQMYLGHLCVYRRALVQQVGGFREGYEGSQDHDLALRVTERTSRVVHVPRVLYHWRIHSSSSAGGQQAKPYAVEAGRRAIADALGRRGEAGVVVPLADAPGHFVVRRPTPKRRVSILSPTNDSADGLDRCLSSLIATAGETPFDVHVLQGRNAPPGTGDWSERLGERFSAFRDDHDLNYSRLVNLGAREAKGDLLLLLAADSECVDPGWLDELAGWALRPGTGAVSCRAVSPDGKLRQRMVSESGFGAAQPADWPGDYGQLLGPANASVVSGACLMIQRETFNQLGGFDEALAELGDLDFCLRATRSGLRNVLLGHVKLVQRPLPGENPNRAKELAIVRERWARELSQDPLQNPNLDPETQTIALRVTRSSG
ncbi:MAG: glycosyltransferase, partial [Myxococcaceae bacterium]